LHWGSVLAVKGSGCTINWQTDKNPSSHSATDVFVTEAAAWAALNSIASSDGASEAPLYPEPDPEASDPQTSPRSAEVGGASPAQEATQPGTSRSCVELLYINGKGFEVPSWYTGFLPTDQGRCDDLWKVIVHEK
jgi:hypothetical protein